ncbi:MAG: ABC transporter permease, partial [Phycisphaeraceae bacterium]|nr:ABC transporter permease [Phycisphaeraceae bacterium]
MTTILNDIKFGIRMLAKHPAYTGIIVLTLALGIGANTAVFSFLDRFLLRPLPVKNPGELVKPERHYQWRHEDGSLGGTDTDAGFAYPLYINYRDQSQVFSGVVAYTLFGRSRMSEFSNLRVGDSMEQVVSMAVSSNYFSVLGTKPVVGRFFLAQEEAGYSVHPVAVISHRLWQRHFEGDPAVLGQTICLNNQILTVVGVSPSEFTGTVRALNPGVYVPLGVLAQMNDYSLDNRDKCALGLLGRLKPGVSRTQAEARLLALAQGMYRDEPSITHTHIPISDGSRGTNPFSGDDQFWMVTALCLFQMPPMLILLVACANVANILLARGMMRQKEIAIRRAIGASRRDVIRQLLVESSLLALLSGACGALMAHWLMTMIPALFPVIQPFGIPFGMDGRVLCLTLLGSLGSVFLFGLAPALQASRPNVMGVLKEGAGAVTLFARRFSMRNTLVVIQVAVSVIVLSFGVLCLLSLRAMRVDGPGYDTENVLAVSVNLEDELPAAVDVSQLFTRLQERVTSFPGVRAVSLVGRIPLSIESHCQTGATVENVAIPAGQRGLAWRFERIGPGAFQTLGVPLIRGREFSIQDRSGTAKVMIVNELMARRCWPGQDPIGKYVTLQDGEAREVVGVVKAVKLRTIRAKPEPLSFLPLAQPMIVDGRPVSYSAPCLLIRTQGDHESTVSLLQEELA